MKLLLQQQTAQVAEGIQLILGLITTLGAGISVYIGLRIANTENKKEIEFLEKTIKEVSALATANSQLINDHIKVDNHVSKKEIKNLEDRLTEFIHNNQTTHDRIEEKLDKLSDRILDGKGRL